MMDSVVAILALSMSAIALGYTHRANSLKIMNSHRESAVTEYSFSDGSVVVFYWVQIEFRVAGIKVPRKGHPHSRHVRMIAKSLNLPWDGEKWLPPPNDDD